ncbi:hypothetical protein [Deinococcus wulumuqiensis]|uniref:hypothetical protein n=1 Tax=Deinococcus wulumuqiensis TaxID=980427 RepID=UPI002430A06C|nr:hypothetical protein [Deinococcus wulumuqiensis]
MQSLPAYLKDAAAADNARRRPRDAGDLWDDHLPHFSLGDFSDAAELQETLEGQGTPQDVVDELVAHWCLNA